MKSIINWSKVSELLAKNRDSIREDRYPKKYTKTIETLKRWEQNLIKEIEIYHVEQQSKK